MPRIDIPDKVFGKYNFNVDAKLPGMLHARVVRPTEARRDVVKINGFKQKMPGVVRVMPMGKHFVVVVAEREEQAIAAAKALDITWSKPTTPPFSTTAGLFDWIRKPAVAEQLDARPTPATSTPRWPAPRRR